MPRNVMTALGPVSLRASSDEKAWADRLGGAARRVAAVWGSSRASAETGALVVTICADDADFAQVAEGLDADTAGVTTASGVFISPTAVRTLTGQGLVVLLAHEFTHAVLGHVGQDRTALWLREGAAEWTAEHDVDMPVTRLWPHLMASIAPAAGSDGSTATASTPTASSSDASNPSGPPTDEDFTRDRALAYEQATAYVTYAAVMLGSPAIVRLTRGRPDDARARQAFASELSGHPSFASWLRGSPHAP